MISKQLLELDSLLVDDLKLQAERLRNSHSQDDRELRTLLIRTTAWVQAMKIQLIKQNMRKVLHG
ncbi:hypothetical protein [Paraferrimonas sedimenticola]|uniref:Uncharacterized protein n=1 Tax=Paraferrimonas sedimenticola TaxID=375674 RepID=A0AA37RST9_9GAMM|nr:hypothetical protein [Paraferrimonas sedimenticola]GLP95310.1 hypothetical protein GCM10007895_06160 [Paraferrimonas sedimenticola]